MSDALDEEWNNVVELFRELRKLLDHCNRAAQHSWAIIDKVKRSASIITLELEGLEREISDIIVSNDETSYIGIEPYSDHLLSSLQYKSNILDLPSQNEKLEELEGCELNIDLDKISDCRKLDAIKTWNFCCFLDEDSIVSKRMSILKNIKTPFYMTPQNETHNTVNNLNFVQCLNFDSHPEDVIKSLCSPQKYYETPKISLKNNSNRCVSGENDIETIITSNYNSEYVEVDRDNFESDSNAPLSQFVNDDQVVIRNPAYYTSTDPRCCYNYCYEWQMCVPTERYCYAFTECINPSCDHSKKGCAMLGQKNFIKPSKPSEGQTEECCPVSQETKIVKYCEFSDIKVIEGNKTVTGSIKSQLERTQVGDIPYAMSEVRFIATVIPDEKPPPENNRINIPEFPSHLAQKKKISEPRKSVSIPPKIFAKPSIKYSPVSQKAQLVPQVRAESQPQIFSKLSYSERGKSQVPEFIPVSVEGNEEYDDKFSERESIKRASPCRSIESIICSEKSSRSTIGDLKSESNTSVKKIYTDQRIHSLSSRSTIDRDDFISKSCACQKIYTDPRTPFCSKQNSRSTVDRDDVISKSCTPQKLCSNQNIHAEESADEIYQTCRRQSTRTPESCQSTTGEQRYIVQDDCNKSPSRQKQRTISPTRSLRSRCSKASILKQKVQPCKCGKKSTPKNKIDTEQTPIICSKKSSCSTIYRDDFKSESGTFQKICSDQRIHAEEPGADESYQTFRRQSTTTPESGQSTPGEQRYIVQDDCNKSPSRQKQRTISPTRSSRSRCSKASILKQKVQPYKCGKKSTPKNKIDTEQTPIICSKKSSCSTIYRDDFKSESGTFQKICSDQRIHAEEPGADESYQTFRRQSTMTPESGQSTPGEQRYIVQDDCNKPSSRQKQRTLSPTRSLRSSGSKASILKQKVLPYNSEPQTPDEQRYITEDGYFATPPRKQIVPSIRGLTPTRQELDQVSQRISSIVDNLPDKNYSQISGPGTSYSSQTVIDENYFDDNQAQGRRSSSPQENLTKTGWNSWIPIKQSDGTESKSDKTYVLKISSTSTSELSDSDLRKIKINQYNANLSNGPMAVVQWDVLKRSPINQNQKYTNKYNPPPKCEGVNFQIEDIKTTVGPDNCATVKMVNSQNEVVKTSRVCFSDDVGKRLFNISRGSQTEESMLLRSFTLSKRKIDARKLDDLAPMNKMLISSSTQCESEKHNGPEITLQDSYEDIINDVNKDTTQIDKPLKEDLASNKKTFISSSTQWETEHDEPEITSKDSYELIMKDTPQIDKSPKIRRQLEKKSVLFPSQSIVSQSKEDENRHKKKILNKNLDTSTSIESVILTQQMPLFQPSVSWLKKFAKEFEDKRQILKKEQIKAQDGPKHTYKKDEDIHLKKLKNHTKSVSSSHKRRSNMSTSMDKILLNRNQEQQCDLKSNSRHNKLVPPDQIGLSASLKRFFTKFINTNMTPIMNNLQNDESAKIDDAKEILFNMLFSQKDDGFDNLENMPDLNACLNFDYTETILNARSNSNIAKLSEKDKKEDIEKDRKEEKSQLQNDSKIEDAKELMFNMLFSHKDNLENMPDFDASLNFDYTQTFLNTDPNTAKFPEKKYDAIIDKEHEKSQKQDESNNETIEVSLDSSSTSDKSIKSIPEKIITCNELYLKTTMEVQSNETIKNTETKTVQDIKQSKGNESKKGLKRTTGVKVNELKCTYSRKQNSKDIINKYSHVPPASIKSIKNKKPELKWKKPDKVKNIPVELSMYKPKDKEDFKLTKDKNNCKDYNNTQANKLVKHYETSLDKGYPVKINKSSKHLLNRKSIPNKRHRNVSCYYSDSSNFSFRDYINQQQAICEAEIIKILNTLNGKEIKNENDLKSDSQYWISNCHIKLLKSIEKLYTNDFQSDTNIPTSKFSRNVKEMIHSIKRKDKIEIKDIEHQSKKDKKPLLNQKLLIESSVHPGRGYNKQKGSRDPYNLRAQPSNKYNLTKHKNKDLKTFTDKNINQNKNESVKQNEVKLNDKNESQDSKTSNKQNEEIIDIYDQFNKSELDFQNNGNQQDFSTFLALDKVESVEKPDQNVNFWKGSETIDGKKLQKFDTDVKLQERQKDSPEEVIKIKDKSNKKECKLNNIRPEIRESNKNMDHQEQQTECPKEVNQIMAKLNKKLQNYAQIKIKNTKPEIRENTQNIEESHQKLKQTERPKEYIKVKVKPYKKYQKYDQNKFNIRPEIREKMRNMEDYVKQVNDKYDAENKKSKEERIISFNEPISTEEHKNDLKESKELEFIVNADAPKRARPPLTLEDFEIIENKSETSWPSIKKFDSNLKTIIQPQKTDRKFAKEQINASCSAKQKPAVSTTSLEKAQSKQLEGELEKMRQTRENYIEKINNALLNYEKKPIKLFDNHIKDFDLLCDIHRNENAFKKDPGGSKSSDTLEKGEKSVYSKDFRQNVVQKSKSNIELISPDLSKNDDSESSKSTVIDRSVERNKQLIEIKHNTQNYERIIFSEQFEKHKHTKVNFDKNIDSEPREESHTDVFEDKKHAMIEFQNEIHQIKKNMQQKTSHDTEGRTKNILDKEKKFQFRESLESIQFWRQLETQQINQKTLEKPLNEFKSRHKNIYSRPWADQKEYENLKNMPSQGDTLKIQNPLVLYNRQFDISSLKNEWEVKLNNQIEITESSKSTDEFDIYQKTITKWQMTPSIEELQKSSKSVVGIISLKHSKKIGTKVKTPKFNEEKQKKGRKGFTNFTMPIVVPRQQCIVAHSSTMRYFYPESKNDLLSTIAKADQKTYPIEKITPEYKKLKSKKMKSKNPPTKKHNETAKKDCETKSSLSFDHYNMDKILKREKNCLCKTAAESFLKILQDLSFTAEAHVSLMKLALRKENLELVSQFHVESKSQYTKEKSKELYKHLVSVDKSSKQKMCGDCDAATTSSHTTTSLPVKYDGLKDKSDSKFKVTKTTLEYVHNELITLKSQINQTLFAEVRDEIAARTSISKTELDAILQSVDSELDKIKTLEKHIDILIRDLKQRIEVESELDELHTRFEKDFVSKYEYETIKLSQDEALKKLKHETISETKTQLNEKLTEINELIQHQIREHSCQEKMRNNSETSLRKKLEHIGEVLQSELNNIQAVLNDNAADIKENSGTVIEDMKSKDYNKKRNLFEKTISIEEKQKATHKTGTSPKHGISGSVIKAKQSLKEKMNANFKEKYVKKK